MAKTDTPDDAEIGRFDQSFLIHMIKDFFVILIIVTILEFALKAALVWYDFRFNGQEDVAEAADEIADNVRAIMRNEGGPVAARTMYPILDKNWSDLGYTIAIEPSEVTIRSIRDLYDYVPEGIPMLALEDEQTNVVATTEIKAESFCLDCHVEASVGEVLGTVTVRNYLANDFAAWWQGVQLTLGLAVGKIILHSILLFILLRARLEPLMRLRSVVSNLSKAFGGLDQRAEVKSADEFGVLSRDLNLFLNRVSGLVNELDRILRDVVSVNDDILYIQTDLRGQVDGILGSTRKLERSALMGAKREPMLSPEWFDAFKGAVEELDEQITALPDAPRENATRTVEALRTVISHAEAQITTNEALFGGLADLGEQTESFQKSMAEMIRLEERMKSIVENGRDMVSRLQPKEENPAE